MHILICIGEAIGVVNKGVSYFDSPYQHTKCYNKSMRNMQVLCLKIYCELVEDCNSFLDAIY